MDIAATHLADKVNHLIYDDGVLLLYSVPCLISRLMMLFQFFVTFGVPKSEDTLTSEEANEFAASLAFGIGIFDMMMD